MTSKMMWMLMTLTMLTGVQARAQGYECESSETIGGTLQESQLQIHFPVSHGSASTAQVVLVQDSGELHFHATASQSQPGFVSQDSYNLMQVGLNQGGAPLQGQLKISKRPPFCGRGMCDPNSDPLVSALITYGANTIQFSTCDESPH